MWVCDINVEPFKGCDRAATGRERYHEWCWFYARGRASKELAQNGVRRGPVPDPFCGARRTLCAAKELAQNGVRRGPVPDTFCGARRTLCAAKELAQNGVRRGPVPDPFCGARRTLCASCLSRLGMLSIFMSRTPGMSIVYVKNGCRQDD